MSPEEKVIRESVDRLLMDQGCYIPVEILLAEERLLYTDYEAWRNGNVECLEDTLFGDPVQSREMMQQAAKYSRMLGLVSETLQYQTWGKERGRRLCFSKVHDVNSLFHTSYGKSDDTAQTDLLMDTSGLVLCNRIVGALIGRDYKEASRLLGCLAQAEPDNSRLQGLTRLIDEATTPGTPIGDTAIELQRIKYELWPLARKLLGSGTRHYMAPIWQRLMQALEQVPFEPDAPEMHRSYAALEAEDWKEVKRSVEKESNWQKQPLLLRRHARACGRLHHEIEAISGWFRLCWNFPQQADVISDEAGPKWHRYWQIFLELDPELPNCDFPAWILIQQPGLVQTLTGCQLLDDPDAAEGFRATAALVGIAPGVVVNTEQIEKRKTLQAENSALFTCYLELAARRKEK